MIKGVQVTVRSETASKFKVIRNLLIKNLPKILGQSDVEAQSQSVPLVILDKMILEAREVKMLFSLVEA
tara:strand:- start:361 stop:567 length:207 start_codon:yes stop_codon:yes gene_type:complete